MIIVTFFAVVLIASLIWCRMIRKAMYALGCKRSFSRPAVFVGEEAELIEVVRNDSPVIIPWLLLESKISPYLRLGKQDNLHISGDTHFCSQFTLMPHQQIQRRHRVRFLHRGSYNLGNAAMTVGDVLGLRKYQRMQNLDAPVLVYPQLIHEENLPAPMSCHLREITRQPQLLQDPFLVRGLRAYQPGDPIRDIHWAATARTGEVQVRLHDYSAQTKLLVVLNAQLHDRQWHDHISQEHAEKIEYGISLAATACIHALQEGLAAGFAANMPLDTEKGSTIMLPSGGRGWEETLLAAFARLKVVRAEHFHLFLNRLNSLTGMDILILSSYDSVQIQNAVRELKNSGNQVMFQLLEGGNVCSVG